MRNQMRKERVWLSKAVLGIFFVPILSYAALTVVSMGDNAISAKPYVTPIQKPNEAAFKQYIKGHPTINARYTNRLEKVVQPCECHLTLGHVTPHFIHSLKRVPAFFVIDSGSKSLTWLKQNEAVFVKEGVKGFLINSTAQEALRLSHHSALSIIPASCDGLSAALKTAHIPLFVKAGWVTQ